MKKYNIKKIILFFILFIYTSFLAVAQKNCGTENTFLFKQLYPNRYDSIEGKVSAFIQMQKLLAARILNVRTIPVVVHVLYNYNNTDPTYISDAKIFSQIDIINQDFRRQNADWTTTPAVFQGLVADCEVRFCLASIDPNGNTTSGIIRKYTDSLNFSTKTGPKHNNTGGSDAWDNNKYLNIWVVPRIFQGSEVLGYANYPWENAGADDGVVIRYSVFGSLPPVSISYNLGRTTTHEIGHWLGLKHIWGDEGACSSDDDVSDTPKQADKNYGCPSFPLVDACTSGNGVMFMNYMDYTNDNCMYMFTLGQKVRMDYYLLNDRSSVVNNAASGCGGCPYALVLNNSVTINSSFRSVNQITSSQMINTGIICTYKTGSLVRLVTGFKASNGSKLTIKTNEICYPPY